MHTYSQPYRDVQTDRQTDGRTEQFVHLRRRPFGCRVGHRSKGQRKHSQIGGDLAYGGSTTTTKHAIKLATKLKTNPGPAGLAQLFQPSLAFCCKLQPVTAYRTCVKFYRKFYCIFIVVVIAPLVWPRANNRKPTAHRTGHTTPHSGADSVANSRHLTSR